eukprot:1137704-Pelagomonas_calceolata.AAC.3
MTIRLQGVLTRELAQQNLMVAQSKAAPTRHEAGKETKPDGSQGQAHKDKLPQVTNPSICGSCSSSCPASAALHSPGFCSHTLGAWSTTSDAAGSSHAKVKVGALLPTAFPGLLWELDQQQLRQQRPSSARHDLWRRFAFNHLSWQGWEAWSAVAGAAGPSLCRRIAVYCPSNYISGAWLVAAITTHFSPLRMTASSEPGAQSWQPVGTALQQHKHVIVQNIEHEPEALSPRMALSRAN